MADPASLDARLERGASRVVCRNSRAGGYDTRCRGAGGIALHLAEQRIESQFSQFLLEV